MQRAATCCIFIFDVFIFILHFCNAVMMCGCCSVCFFVSLTPTRDLWEADANRGIASTRAVCGHACGTLSWLLIKRGWPIHCSQSYPWEGGPGLYFLKGSFEYEPGSKPVGSVLHGLSASVAASRMLLWAPALAFLKNEL